LLLRSADSLYKLSAMMKLAQIQQDIAAIQRELATLGPLHPGRISEQYNICGSPGCRCKDAKHPQKHGPYYQLSYTWRGRHHTRFVRPDQLAAMQQKATNHRRLRELIEHWVALAVETEQLERAQAKSAHGR
jgi:hypothetical protein